MSLINDALRKAQRERTGPPSDFGGTSPAGGPRSGRRGSGPSTQTIVLIAGGAVALFVVCVVLAVIVINRPSAPPVAVAKPAPAKPVVDPAAPAPIVVLPKLPEPVPAPAPAAPVKPPVGKFEERIQTLVDSFRVAGIRSSGADSKVLLNERVYRLNDIVDRVNGLRLTQVGSDSLTFTTADGTVYVKSF
jgi:hypothetical protein